MEKNAAANAAEKDFAAALDAVVNSHLELESTEIAEQKELLSDLAECLCAAGSDKQARAEKKQVKKELSTFFKYLSNPESLSQFATLFGTVYRYFKLAGNDSFTEALSEEGVVVDPALSKQFSDFHPFFDVSRSAEYAERIQNFYESYLVHADKITEFDENFLSKFPERGCF